MDPGIKLEWYGEEFVHWEAVSSYSNRFGNIDIGSLREGDMDWGGKAPYKFIKLCNLGSVWCGSGSGDPWVTHDMLYSRLSRVCQALGQTNGCSNKCTYACFTRRGVLK